MEKISKRRKWCGLSALLIIVIALVLLVGLTRHSSYSTDRCLSQLQMIAQAVDSYTLKEGEMTYDHPESVLARLETAGYLDTNRMNRLLLKRLRLPSDQDRHASKQVLLYIEPGGEGLPADLKFILWDTYEITIERK